MTRALGVALVLAAGACATAHSEPEDAGPVSDVDAGDARACGDVAELCCAGSTCNSGAVCLGGVCQSRKPPLDAGPTPDGGCGAFVTCNGACTDLKSDGKNCGGCGHDCRGLQCQEGLCSSVALAIGQQNGQLDLVRIAVDATSVYWTAKDTGTVSKVSKTGGPVVVLASGIPFAFGIAVDATAVYFTSEGTTANGFTDGAVMKAPLDADAGAVVKIATLRRRAQEIAVDASGIYWLDKGTSVSDGSVNSCPLAGCGTAPTTLASSLATPYGIALDASRVFFTSFGANGSVYGVPMGGGSTVLFATGQALPSGIAADGTSIYWATYGDGLVSSAPTGDGGGATIADTQGGPREVRVDSNAVYWTEATPPANAGAVVKCPLAGCKNGNEWLPIVARATTAKDIAIDDAYLYWLTADGNVMKVAK